MLPLPGNCRAGDFTVTPKNWKSPSANVNLLWQIQYWFYDDNLAKRKLIVIKGMNRLKTLKEKRDLTQRFIDNELDLLQKQGYNYITKAFSVIHECELSPFTPVSDALDHAFKKLQADPATLASIKSCLKYVHDGINAVGLSRKPITDINPWHITMVLEKCEEVRKLSASSYNHYRAYLRMVFKRLVKMQVISSNPVTDVEKKKQVRRLRTELDKQRERPQVRLHLQKVCPEFWTFVNIFFHSGSRITEMISLKPSDVDIAGQRFKVLVKKGREGKEQWRPIKDIVVSEWEKVLQEAGENDYLFSIGLKPGTRKIRPEQITRRWKRYVKKGLGITADLYSLKHSNLDETAGALQSHREAVKIASEQAGHTTPVVTLKHYLQGEGERQNATVRGVWNEF